MDANSIFPGKDVDEMLNNKEDLEDLDDKINFLTSTLDLDDLKALEDGGSEIAEEAMIAQAREEAGEETVDEVMSDTETWRENPRNAIGRLEKALEYDEDAIENGSLQNDRGEILKTLLDNDHFYEAKRFDRLVDETIERSGYKHDDIEEDQSREDIITDRYQELSYWTPASLEKKTQMNRYFDEVSMRDNDWERLVEFRYEDGEYRDAFRVARQNDLETIEIDDEEKTRREIIEDGYEEKMGEDNYVEAAKIAREAREVNDSDSSEIGKDSYEDLEKEAATKAFEESIEKSDYEQAERIANDYRVGDNEELQLKLSAARAKNELDEDQYEALSSKIGPDLEKDVEEGSGTTEAYESGVESEPSSDSDSDSGYDSSGIEEGSGTTEVYESESESDDSSGGFLSSIRSKL